MDSGKEPDIRELIRSARASLRKQDFNEAESRLKQATTLVEKSGQLESEAALQVHLTLAVCYELSGQYARAMSKYTRVAMIREKLKGEASPEHISVLFRLARACEKAGEIDDAWTIYDRANELAVPTDDEMPEAMASPARHERVDAWTVWTQGGDQESAGRSASRETPPVSSSGEREPVRPPVSSSGDSEPVRPQSTATDADLPVVVPGPGVLDSKVESATDDEEDTLFAGFEQEVEGALSAESAVLQGPRNLKPYDRTATTMELAQIDDEAMGVGLDGGKLTDAPSADESTDNGDVPGESREVAIGVEREEAKPEPSQALAKPDNPFTGRKPAETAEQLPTVRRDTALPRELRIKLKQAFVAFDSGNFIASQPLLADAHHMLLERGLEESPEALECLHRIGIVHLERREYVRAVSEFSRLAIVMEKALGESHPDFRHLLRTLAQACEKAGRTEDARAFYLRANFLSRKYSTDLEEINWKPETMDLEPEKIATDVNPFRKMADDARAAIDTKTAFGATRKTESPAPNTVAGSLSQLYSNPKPTVSSSPTPEVPIPAFQPRISKVESKKAHEEPPADAATAGQSNVESVAPGDPETESPTDSSESDVLEVDPSSPGVTASNSSLRPIDTSLPPGITASHSSLQPIDASPTPDVTSSQSSPPTVDANPPADEGKASWSYGDDHPPSYVWSEKETKKTGSTAWSESEISPSARNVAWFETDAETPSTEIDASPGPAESVEDAHEEDKGDGDPTACYNALPVINLDPGASHSSIPMMNPPSAEPPAASSPFSSHNDLPPVGSSPFISRTDLKPVQNEAAYNAQQADPSAPLRWGQTNDVLPESFDVDAAQEQKLLAQYQVDSSELGEPIAQEAPPPDDVLPPADSRALQSTSIMSLQKMRAQWQVSLKNAETTEESRDTQSASSTFMKLVAQQYDASKPSTVTTAPEPSENLKQLMVELEPTLEAARTAVAAGKYRDALKIYKQVYEELDEYGESESQFASDCLTQLGSVYENMGEYSRAVSEYSRLAINLEKRLGAGHPECIMNLSRLATVCEKAGRIEEARVLHDRAVQLAEYSQASDVRLRNTVQQAQITFLKSSDRALKKSIDSADALSTLDALASDEETRKGLINRKVQQMKSRGLLGYLLSAVLLIVALFYIPTLMKTLSPQASTPEQTRTSLVGTVFRSADGKSALTFGEDGTCQLPVDGRMRKVRLVVLSNDITDVLWMFQAYAEKREIWLQKGSTAIRAENGTVFYAPDAPEVRIISEMRRIANYAQEYFQRKHTYPRNKREWNQTSAITYTNPTTGKADKATLQVFSRFAALRDIFDGAETIDAARQFLLKGGTWLDEAQLRPCGINCAARHTERKHGEEYVAPNFFMHCADTQGKLISAGLPGTVCTIVLEDGNNLGSLPLTEEPAPTETAESLSSACAYVVSGEGDLSSLLPLRFSVPITFGVLMVITAWIWLASDAKSRIAKPNSPPKLTEVIFVVLGAAAIIWSLIRMIP